MTAVMPAGWAALEDMASYLTSAAKDDLPRGELLFARDMLDLLDSGRLPTPKQEAWLRSIYRRALSEAAP